MGAAPEPTNLPIRRLCAQYADFAKLGQFGGSSRLYALGRTAWQVARSCSGPSQAIATALALLFCDSAGRLDGKPLTVADGEAWFAVIHNDIHRCLQIMAGDSAEPAGEAIAALLRVYAALSDQISN